MQSILCILSLSLSSLRLHSFSLSLSSLPLPLSPPPPSDISSTMRYTSSPADFLSSPSRYQFNGDLLLSTLSTISPSTAIIFLSSKKLKHPQEVAQSSHTPLPIPQSLSETEPIYGTQYKVYFCKLKYAHSII